MKAIFEISETQKTIHFELEDLNLTKEDWENLSKDEQNEKVEEYWNDHHDSVTYWCIDSITNA